jgi:hypothetical protein
MSINRIQFQTGLSMPEFLKQFGSEEQCEVALEQSQRNYESVIALACAFIWLPI